jgi:hypothetical protein
MQTHLFFLTGTHSRGSRQAASYAAPITDEILGTLRAHGLAGIDIL